MKGRLLLLLVLLAAVCAADAQKRTRHRRRRTTTTTPAPELQPDALDPALNPAPLPDQDSESAQVDDAEEDLVELALKEKVDEINYQEHQKTHVAQINSINTDDSGEAQGNGDFMEDPCLKVHCSAGRVCEIDEQGEAQCICIKECPYETDQRRKVCTNNNETWPSDCDVYRQRCHCLDGHELCQGPEYHHLQIEYYGACKEMPACTESEMADFPRRMRDWLFNIMRDLAERHELSAHYVRMEREAEVNLTRRWSNAAIWKWCDLDAHDKNRYVSRHELFPIRAPLMSLEHCISPFLDDCDADHDHRITLAEWGRCLQLDEEELEDRCDELLEESAADN